MSKHGLITIPDSKVIKENNNMSKFYLTSGNIEFVVTAVDSEGAALWMINQVIDQTFPPEQFDENDQPDELIDYTEALDVFDDQIMVSEIGFGRDEAGILDSEWLFMKWFQLSSALNNLLDQLEQ